jgi:hypothetical protein
VHQVLVARALKVRDMDHGQSATDHHHEHCGFLFPEYESYVDRCESQWTNYMGRVLARPPESVVAAASELSDPEHHSCREGHDEESAWLSPDPRQGDLYV